MIYVAVYIFFVTGSLGSKIEFQNDPLYISKGLTRSLHLRCSLVDTTDPTSVIGKRELSQTVENIEHVSSIIISKSIDDEGVASVTTYTSPSATLNHNGVSVTGNVSLTTGPEHGFLDLIWTNPGINESGGYTCEVNGIDSRGHNVVFTSSLEVGTEFPSNDDLIKHVHALEDINDVYQKRLSALEAAIRFLKPPHSEEGTVHCGSSSHWSPNPNHSNAKLAIYDVLFKQPYEKEPTVNLGIYRMDLSGGSNTRIHVDILNPSKTGFQVRCATWDGSMVYDIAVRWTSVVS